MGLFACGGQSPCQSETVPLQSTNLGGENLIMDISGKLVCVEGSKGKEYRELGGYDDAGRSGDHGVCISIVVKILKNEGLLNIIKSYLEKNRLPLTTEFEKWKNPVFGEPINQLYPTYAEYYVAALRGQQIEIDRELDINLLNELYLNEFISDGTVKMEKYHVDRYHVYQQEINPSIVISTKEVPTELYSARNILSVLIDKGIIKKHDDDFYFLLNDGQ